MNREGVEYFDLHEDAVTTFLFQAVLENWKKVGRAYDQDNHAGSHQIKWNWIPIAVPNM